MEERGLVEEEALLHALNENRLAGAALDVFSEEPTTVSPLFELAPGGATQRTFRFERLTHVVTAPGGAALVATKLDQHELTGDKAY